MLQVFKYSFFDMIRNRWMYVYLGFFLVLTISLFLLSNDVAKVIISLTNVILYLAPLVGILFGSMYYYNSEEFLELLLAQPQSRRSVFSGLYLGMAASLSLSLTAGVGIPMLLFGAFGSPEVMTLFILIGISVVLSIIFSLISFYIALNFKNRIKGFGISILTWLFFAIIYDGVFLLLLLIFKEYPLEKITLGLSLFNPIDLARILILINLDVSAMMGYTGAVLQKFLGSSVGSIMIIIVLLLWMIIPFMLMLRKSERKDF